MYVILLTPFEISITHGTDKLMFEGGGGGGEGANIYMFLICLIALCFQIDCFLCFLRSVQDVQSTHSL